MSNPKRHHYVQRAYLHRWSNSAGNIYICDLSNGNIYEGPAKSAAWEKYYYCIDDPNHPEYRFELESLLAQDIEGPAGPMLDKLDAEAALSLEEKSHLALYVAFQRTRVPYFEKFSNELSEKMTKEALLKTLNDKESFDRFMREQGEKYKDWESIPSREEMIKTIEEDRLKIEYPRGHSIKTMVELSLPLSDLYARCRWILLEAKGSSFITSDNPGVTMSLAHKDGSKLGETTFPVSPRHCLLIDQETSGKFDISEEDIAGVRELNRRTLLHATRYLFGNDKAELSWCYSEYLRLHSLSSAMKSAIPGQSKPFSTGEKLFIKRIIQ